ncbi:MAG: TATA-box-binding protein [Ignisphaera sp.]
MNIDIVNIVASTHLHRELDLDLLSLVMRDIGTVIYDKERFPGLILKTSDRVSYLVFRTGKIVVVGCRNENHIEKAIKDLVKQISKVVGDIPSSLSVKIQNIVATIDLGYDIDLETLSERLEHSVYIPDEFPGLVYRAGVGKPSALIFSSGRIVVTGATSIEDIEALVNEIHRITSPSSVERDEA